MRNRKLFLLLIVSGFGLAGCSSTQPGVTTLQAEGPQIEPASPIAFLMAGPATKPFEIPPISPLKASIRDVQDAVDMDTAIDAYTRGLSVDPSSIALQKAYVRRMVDFDVPLLAADAASKLVAEEPNAPLARAVLALAAGREGNMVDALTNISLAVRRAPEDRFVQRTAGHLLAWYDNNPRPPSLPGTVRVGLQSAHAQLDESAEFVSAYEDATDFYRAREKQLARAPATPTTRSATGPAVAGMSFDEPMTPEELPAYAGAYGGLAGGTMAIPPAYEPYPPYYGEPYAYAPYDLPGYWGWTPGIFLGTGFGFIAFEGHHHHDRDREGRHHGTLASIGRNDVFLPTGRAFRGAASAAGRGSASGRAYPNSISHGGSFYGGSNFRGNASPNFNDARDFGLRGSPPLTGDVGTPPTGYTPFMGSAPNGTAVHSAPAPSASGGGRSSGGGSSSFHGGGGGRR